jgi:hypothetical protein
MNITLTPEEYTALHAALMQLPNSSGTYPVLLKVVAAVNDPAIEPKEVEIS